MNHFSVRFLVRPDCHLCEEATGSVHRAASLVGARVVEVDVDSDPRLVAEWGIRIPVVLDPVGHLLAEGRIRFWPLLGALAIARLRGAFGGSS